eukprot:GHVS01028187.1.p1 GENE.GHVS01028187.1~~GHVS01028187.1.p1  ORF type:complete len:103 (+),score=4.69 GHVS01028187.1:273-581(+)
MLGLVGSFSEQVRVFGLDDSLTQPILSCRYQPAHHVHLGYRQLNNDRRLYKICRCAPRPSLLETEQENHSQKLFGRTRESALVGICFCWPVVCRARWFNRDE